MKPQLIAIEPIIHKKTVKKYAGCFAVCLLKNNIDWIKIDGETYMNAANTIFFLHPKTDWEISKRKSDISNGYILYLTPEILNNPLLSKLHINEVRLFSGEEIPKINLAPGIEKRVYGILEMIDELVDSHLNHKEDAIISLLNTFFVYCDGQCNIKSVISENNSKKSIVYQYKKLMDKHVCELHEVEEYANILNISSKYLNECVKEVLGVTAKSLITEQRIMRARHQLKFSDKSIKEIGFGLGFSSADYFSYFYKQHTGFTPSMHRA
ncbi:AraC family transcriptional regulator [Maribacter algicola]|uniref:AraC family transcriptional regulator n=1 Tax=Maribacter algicola TaxID=2498892 RepID=A0A3R8S2J4_9FLAO|nr:helix-turn-helix domain-containing protein [Maribacter algicola]RRQ50457.1 AraC family transcriptional regulator [Maribacter algicola]